MKRINCLKMLSLLLACAGMLVAQPALAAEQMFSSSNGGRPMAAAPVPLYDVALMADGLLQGQVIDGQGIGVTRAPVVVLSGGREIARTETDAQGRFVVSGLRGGMVQVHSGSGNIMCRVWAANSAPPSALSLATLVSAKSVVRGQSGGCGFWGFVSNPWITTGLITTAIAVPVAVAASGDSAS